MMVDVMWVDGGSDGGGGQLVVMAVPVVMAARSANWERGTDHQGCCRRAARVGWMVHP